MNFPKLLAVAVVSMCLFVPANVTEAKGFKSKKSRQNSHQKSDRRQHQKSRHKSHQKSDHKSHQNSDHKQHKKSSKDQHEKDYKKHSDKYHTERQNARHEKDYKKHYDKYHTESPSDQSAGHDGQRDERRESKRDERYENNNERTSERHRQWHERQRTDDGGNSAGAYNRRWNWDRSRFGDDDRAWEAQRMNGETRPADRSYQSNYPRQFNDRKDYRRLTDSADRMERLRHERYGHRREHVEPTRNAVSGEPRALRPPMEDAPVEPSGTGQTQDVN